VWVLLVHDKKAYFHLAGHINPPIWARINAAWQKFEILIVSHLLQVRRANALESRFLSLELQTGIFKVRTYVVLALNA